MDTTVISVFDNRADAEQAISVLEDNNYDSHNMSVLMLNREETMDMAETTGTRVAKGAVSGATTGGVIGGIAGLLVGIGAVAIPGVGAVLIGGPLAAALGLSGAAATTVSGAATGALAGGLLGALTGIGVPEDTARRYESRIKAGAILLAVPTRGNDTTEVKRILENANAQDITVITPRDPTD